MAKIQASSQTIVVNENGEMQEQFITRKLSWGSEPNFVKLYLQDVLYLSDMPSKYSAILFELLKRSCYAGEQEGMQVVVNNSLKRRIKDALGYKNISSVNNAITDFVKTKILYRADVGIYNFNPYLFGKGDWADIAKLRMEINYDDIKGKTFKTVCNYKNEEPQITKKKEQPDPIKDQISLLDEKAS